MSDNTLKVSNKRKNPKVDGKKREPKENDSESQNSSPSHSISSSSPSSSPTSSKLEDQPEPSDQDHTHNEELLSTSPRRRAFPINSHYAPPPTASHFVPTLEAENEEDEEDDKKTKPQKITGTSNQNSSSTTTLSTSSSPPASSSSVLDSIGKSPRRPQAPIPSSASAKIIPGTSSTAEDGVLGKVQKPAQVTRHHSSFHTPSTLFSTSNSLTTSNKPKKVLLQVSGKKRNLQVQDIPSAIPAELASSPKRASSPLSISSSSVARSPEEKKRRLSLGSKMKNSVLGLIKKDNASASPTNSSSGLTYRGGIYSSTYRLSSLPLPPSAFLPPALTSNFSKTSTKQ